METTYHENGQKEHEATWASGRRTGWKPFGAGWQENVELDARPGRQHQHLDSLLEQRAQTGGIKLEHRSGRAGLALAQLPRPRRPRSRPTIGTRTGRAARDSPSANGVVERHPVGASGTTLILWNDWSFKTQSAPSVPTLGFGAALAGQVSLCWSGPGFVLPAERFLEQPGRLGRCADRHEHARPNPELCYSGHFRQLERGTGT